MRSLVLFSIAATTALLFACQSDPKDVPEDGGGRPKGSGVPSDPEGEGGRGGAPGPRFDEMPADVAEACADALEAFGDACDLGVERDEVRAACAAGVDYVDACHDEFLAYFECATSGPFACDDPDATLDVDVCDASGRAVDACVEANVSGDVAAPGDDGPGGSAGRGDAGGSSGAAGRSGSSGSAGRGGAGGSSGSAGKGGSAGSGSQGSGGDAQGSSNAQGSSGVDEGDDEAF
jgi:hypothetical protein